MAGRKPIRKIRQIRGSIPKPRFLIYHELYESHECRVWQGENLLTFPSAVERCFVKFVRFVVHSKQAISG